MDEFKYCIVCGDMFVKNPHQTLKEWMAQKNCSKECADKYITKHFSRNCEACGKPMDLRSIKSFRAKVRFHSECRSVVRSINAWNASEESKICEGCGKVMYRDYFKSKGMSLYRWRSKRTHGKKCAGLYAAKCRGEIK